MASFDIHRKVLTDFWGLGDVQSLDRSITDDEAEEILIQVGKDYNPTTGLNWSVIRAAVKNYRRG